MFVFCLLLTPGVGARGATATPDTLFNKGNEFFQAGNYEKAIAEYQKILSAGFESWQVYYNIGNAYFKQGDIAHAILNFERAKKLEPENEDVNYNLEFATLKTVDRIQELPRFFGAALFDRLSHAISMRVFGILALSIYATLFALLILRILAKSVFGGKGMKAAIVISGICLFLFGSLFVARVYEAETTIAAIVLVDKVDIKSAPDAAGTDVFTLHSGVKVRIEDKSLDWVKIRLADGKVGWMHGTGLAVI